MYLHFISHTHWDREWYETFDAFRFRLVEFMDHLLSILTCRPEYHSFTLDGQMVILEDYLEIRPEKRDEIKKLVRAGRLFIGPWYILPDEFLISGETHVRNLLFGYRLCRDFGTWMAVGYLPDSFGHIAQMPQILKKSNIPYATFWRGVPDTVQESEFFWEAPDGSRVLALYMPFGYGVAANLPGEEERLKARIERVVKNLLPFASTSHLLLTNGSDHVEPDSDFPGKLDLLRGIFPEHHILHSNFPYLFRKIEEEAHDLPVYQGEWRADDRNYLLGGTLSTRVYLKKEHGFFSHTLEGYLEPLFSTLWILGRSYPEDFLRYLWKMLLWNSPHDSICGCSIDPVHEEMMIRYRKMHDLTQKMLQPSFVFQNLTTFSEDDTLVVFNPHPYPVTEYLETELTLQRQKVKEVDFELSKLREYAPEDQEFFGKLLFDSPEEKVEAEILEREETTVFTTPPHTLPEVFRANRYRVGFVVRELPPLGFRVFRIEGKHEREVTIPPREWVLENEFLHLSVSPSGFITLTEKESGMIFPLGPLFEDGADAGDEYDYSPCEEDEVITTQNLIPNISWSRYTRSCQKIRLYYEMSLSEGLTEDRKRRSSKRVLCPLTVEVGLAQGVKRLDITVSFENRVCDHRLRMLILSPFVTRTSYAGAHFAVLKREGNATFPYNDFVFLQEKGVLVGISSRGLREYALKEVEGKTALTLTLLRAVGWLSRNDLLTRRGDAGWPFPTPQAQCLGKHTFEFALWIEKGAFPETTLPRESLLFNRPPLLFQLPQTMVTLSGWRLLELDNPRILLSALKKSEWGEELVLRLYNPTPRQESCTLSLGIDVSRVRKLSLLEEEEEILPLAGKTISLEFGPWEIKTLGILPA